MKFILAVMLLIFSVPPSNAQLQPTHQKSKIVAGVSEAFFAQLQKEDFATERDFMADQLENTISLDDWSKLRKQTIEATGPTPRYTAHGLTYYQQDKLLAAVDFSGQAAVPNTFICGYLIWELPGPDTIGLMRFEQNIVDVDIFRRMPRQTAIQLMTNWRCPSALIESVFSTASN